MESKAEELARLREELKDLKGRMPEHCSGTREYVSVHRATPKLWEKIEDTEDRIKELESS